MNVKPLKGHGAFAAVFHDGQRFQSGPIRCIVRTTDTENNNTLNVGVAVSKKNVRRAIDRNRIKRLLRAASRDVLTSLEHDVTNFGMSEVILIWQRAASHTQRLALSDVEPHVRSVFTSAITTLSSAKSPQ